MTTTVQKKNIGTVPDEQILVVRRDLFFSYETAWSGLKKVDFQLYLELIQKHKEFLPRSVMETDPSFKQIIPYIVFKHDETFFLMQRKATTTEQRLKNKYSLGIGGHIRQEDLVSNSLFDWAKREFYEEVSYSDTFTIEPFGILNDDSNDVGRVHIGLVFILHGTTDNISIKSELKSGVLLKINEIQQLVPYLEPWSQILAEQL
jgi:predicted NUDIX family phosphoesterase